MSIRGDHGQMLGLGFQSGGYEICLAGKMGYGNEKNGGIIEKSIDIIINIRDNKNHYH